ncbi:MAG: hypothetical protein JWP01_1487 [Myxococcales bacterium]|nr:hypothetical protein [Myxococcales bacterium]
MTCERSLALALAVSAAGCLLPEDVTPPALDPEYTSWHRVVLTGDVPGHDDTYRIVYVDPVARLGTSNKDALLVKEIYDKAGDQPGALRSVDIMRKLRAGPATEDEGGWLFTQSSVPFGPETHLDLCWARCHAQAPYSGVWRDYTQ